MKKSIIIIYGVLAYLIGLTGLTAFMLFMGSWNFLPIHVNSNITNSNSLQAISINLIIILLFAFHHSIAARASFKEKLTRLIPAEAERSTYVLISGLFMYVICLYWQPLSGSVWNIDNSTISLILKTIHVLGWLIAVGATFELDHFHLMGLKQSVTMNINEGVTLKENFLYRIVRHPIQTGILMGIWFTPNMSLTQFMLSSCMTVYIFIGLHYEEKALSIHIGEAYLDYKKRVPMLIPFWPVK